MTQRQPQEGSSLTCLPPARGDALVGLGWAEPHQYEDFGTEFLVYWPRDLEELAVVVGLVEESLEFARTGRA